MTDIVERLRGHYDYTQPECYAWHIEAADEIERLREQLKLAVWTDSEHCKLVEADNARLRAALNRIAWNVDGCEPDLGECMVIAQSALKPSP